MAKFNAEDIVGKDYGDYIVISYEGRNNSKTHTYKVRFKETNNTYIRTRDSVKAGTLKDKTKRKAETKKKQVKKTREKGYSTRNISETQILGSISSNDNILVLDQSTKDIGFTIIKNKKIEIFGKIEEQNRSSYIRIKDLITDIEKLRIKHNINSIILEDIYLGYSPLTYRKLAEVIGAIAFYCCVNKINVMLIPYSVWSKNIGLKGSRNQLKIESVKKALQITGMYIDSDDVSDSVCIAYYFLLSRGLIKAENRSISWE